VTSRPAALAETHSAVVVLLGDRAYKVKKPVRLGFLDFSTPELREAACRREVDLNRRLAPDVYEGVARLVGEDGSVLDHVVVMRRMPDDRRLARLVIGGAALDDEIDAIARRMASFHAGAERSTLAEEVASVESTRHRWEAGTEALFDDGGILFDQAVVARTHALACRYLDGRKPLFDARIRRGRAVDGHGDLLADDVFVLPDGPRILDCLDFDERLRVGDGLADMAFLAMDLEHLGRPQLARRLLATYGEHLGDVWPPSLAHHHIAYRAQVRAKVMALRATQGDPAAADAARRLLELSLGHLEAGRVRLVVVGGPPGSGKSSLAGAVAADLDAVLLSSDVTRKELAGVAAGSSLTTELDRGRYTSGWTHCTYDALLGRAETALAMGDTVVLDATWGDEDQRRRARHLASTACADLVELCCWAPPEVCDARIEQRRRAGVTDSDATPQVAAALRSRFRPWPEARLIDTTTTRDAARQAALLVVHAADGVLRG
jgi:aminoglycoside phosphotransferase family enzyme/predicted kinase